MTVISSPVALIVQLYCGTSAASISLAESSFLSSMLRGAGRGPSLACAPRISLNQVLMAPSSSRVPGRVVCSEKGKVMNLEEGGMGVQGKPVHLLVKWHLVPPVPATKCSVLGATFFRSPTECCQARRIRHQQSCTPARNENSTVSTQSFHVYSLLATSACLCIGTDQ